MKLYHGSNVSINQIDLTRSKRGKDFGQGFYLSNNRRQALDMAILTTGRMMSGTPLITEFVLDENILADGTLNVKAFNEYSEEWAEFVLLNRHNNTSTPVHPYDIVIGPIANDRVGLQIRRYELGDITIQQLVKELKFNKYMTIQYFFGTERAIKHLQRV